jgi:hypothetical protein
MVLVRLVGGADCGVEDCFVVIRFFNCRLICDLFGDFFGLFFRV